MTTCFAKSTRCETAVLFLAILAAPASAAPVTVDFESVLVDGDRQFQPGGVFNGFRFATNLPYSVFLVNNGGCMNGCNASGSNSLFYDGIHYGGQPPLRINRPDRRSFKLKSLDVGEALLIAPPIEWNAVGLGLVGTLSSGATIQAFVEIDRIFDGPGGVADFQTVLLPNEFVGVELSQVDVWGLYQLDTLPGSPPAGAQNDRAGFSLDNVTSKCPVFPSPSPSRCSPSAARLSAIAVGAEHCLHALW